MRYMGDLPAGFDPNSRSQLRALTREQIAEIMTALPPASSVLQPEDLAKIVANADLIRDDYAEPLVAIANVTGPGKRQTLLHIGMGAAAGLAVGALAAYLIGR